MKRKITILLSAVMISAVLPMNVMASSSNSINKTKTVAVDDFIDDIYLKIQPNDAIVLNDSIEITVRNADFVDGTDNYKDDNDIIHDIEQYSQSVIDKGAAVGFDEAVQYLNDKGEFTVFGASGIFSDNNSRLPYYIIRRSKTSIEVKLFPISEKYAGKDNVNSTKPYYYIPLNLKATEEGDIQVTVDANETSVSGGGTYTLARSTDTDGSTTTTIAEVNYFKDYIYLADITVKENVKGTFNKERNNGEVKLRLSNGFVFANIADQDKLEIVAGINADDSVKVKAADCVIDGDTLIFELPDKWSKTEKPSSFIIRGLKVLSDD